MIKSVRLVNFFSFEDETIELHPEANIFVGINGSGKSNVLKAFKLLQEGMAGRLRQLILDQWGGFDAIKFKGIKNDESIYAIFLIDTAAFLMQNSEYASEVLYQIEINPQKNTANYTVGELLLLDKGPDSKIPLLDRESMGSAIYKFFAGKYGWEDVEFEEENSQELSLPSIVNSKQLLFHNLVRKKLQELTVYNYFDTTPESKIRRPIIATSTKLLSGDGSNLSQLLNTIKINDKDNYYQIVRHLASVNPNFTGIDFNVIGPNIELMLEEAKYKSSVHVTHVSDGTLRFLCLMAIFFNENRGGFICIDEPELGLHPDMIKAVFDAMIQSTGKTQFLITTHSDHLLDLFGLENIRVVEKDDNNSSKVKALNAKDFEGWYDVFSPGNMWRQGDFGGNRY